MIRRTTLFLLVLIVVTSCTTQPSVVFTYPQEAYGDITRFMSRFGYSDAREFMMDKEAVREATKLAIKEYKRKMKKEKKKKKRPKDKRRSEFVEVQKRMTEQVVPNKKKYNRNKEKRNEEENEK